jgi:hypothetical protein
MADFIGVSGSATYAVALTGIEEMLSILPNNTVNQISAQDMRNVVYTLSEGVGGGGYDGLYTQALPLTVKSTVGLGGLSAGRTFSEVPINLMLDTILFPPVGTDYSISASPASFEIGDPITGNQTVNVSVSITQKTFKVKSATTGSNANPANTFTPVNLPTAPDVATPTKYDGKNVTKNATTTFTLALEDEKGVQTPATAQVTYFYPRFSGYIYLGGKSAYGTDFTFTVANSTTVKNDIINFLSAPPSGAGRKAWESVWGIPTVDANFMKFSKSSSALSESTITPPSGLKCYGVLILLATDSVPKSYQLNGADPPADCFIDLGTTNFTNEYNVIFSVRILIRTASTVASIKYKFNF